MTDKRIKMECPFCHTSAEQIQVQIYSDLTHSGRIYCPTCRVQFSGQGKQNLIDMWNRR